MSLEPNTITDWLQLVQSEYLEIPGLHLTRAQVQRLWGLEPMTCDALLDALVAARFLRQTSRGAYVLADGGSTLQKLAAQSSSGLH